MDDPSPKCETLKQLIIEAVEKCNDADLLDFICSIFMYIG